MEANQKQINHAVLYWLRAKKGIRFDNSRGNFYIIHHCNQHHISETCERDRECKYDCKEVCIKRERLCKELNEVG